MRGVGIISAQRSCTVQVALLVDGKASERIHSTGGVATSFAEDIEDGFGPSIIPAWLQFVNGAADAVVAVTACARISCAVEIAFRIKQKTAVRSVSVGAGR